MNYLAHAVLSGDDPEVLIGNLIADVVRGRHPGACSCGIKLGLRLHQRIDMFTDEHPTFRHSVRLLWPHHRHYSTALVDIFYDHFLARNFYDLTGESLAAFADRVNRAMANCPVTIPAVFHQNAKNLNWLTGYATKTGIRKSLRRLSNRSRFGLDFTSALTELDAYKNHLETDFLLFFPAIRDYAAKEIEVLTDRQPVSTG